MKTKPETKSEVLVLTTDRERTVSAGRLQAELKRKTDGGTVDYDITITRSTHDEDCHSIESADLTDLVRLAQRLAEAVAKDRLVEQEFRDDLGCLASCLEDVIPTGYVFPGIRCGEKSVAWWSLMALLNYLWDVEGRRYRAWPCSSHPYRKIVQLDAWMRGVGAAAGIALPELDPCEIQEPFGVCPICGRNDGYLNLGRAHWFYCRQHQTRWLGGDDVFNTWRTERVDDWKKNSHDIGQFKIVQAAFNPEGC